MAMENFPISLPHDAAASSDDDEEFHLLDTYGVRSRSPKYPVHDCCEFEEAEALRNLIFVQKESDEDEDSSEDDSIDNSEEDSDIVSEDSGDDDNSNDDPDSSDDSSNEEIDTRSGNGASIEQTNSGEIGSPVGATAATLADAVGLPPEAAAAAVAVAEVANNAEAAAEELNTEKEPISKATEEPELKDEVSSTSKKQETNLKDQENATGEEKTQSNGIRKDNLSGPQLVKNNTSDSSINATDATSTIAINISPEKISLSDLKENPVVTPGATASSEHIFQDSPKNNENKNTEGGCITDEKMDTSTSESPNEAITIDEQQLIEQPASTVQTEHSHKNNSVTQHSEQSNQKKKKRKRKKQLLSKAKEPLYYCPHNLDERDDDENTPLHVAIHARKLENVRVLLQAGASVHRRCDGSTPVHTAISIGAIACHASFSLECVELLASNDADLSTRDDSLHTPLYLACMCNLPDVAALILSDHAGRQTLNLRSDRVGGRPLHAAAKFDVPLKLRSSVRTASAESRNRRSNSFSLHHRHQNNSNHQHRGKHGFKSQSDHEIATNDDGKSALSPVLGQMTNSSTAPLTQLLLLTPGIEVDPQNNYGRTPLHIAASRGNWPVVRLLLNAGASVATLDRRGFTPVGLAYKRGMRVPSDLIPVLGGLGSGIPPSSVDGYSSTSSGSIPPARDLIMDPDGKTLIICHELCSRHLTCPPITRNRRYNYEPPPENIRRLNVLLNNDVGILKCSEFESCAWEGEARRASMADILKIHEYSYVEKISQICSELPDHPNAIATLDPDTAISRWSFESALRAAGSVCDAVDRIMAGDFRNAFCAVRPPGHHAGPRGIVKCANDPEGSHGFCLLNNVAIGAAYARSMYRNDGIKKVAIVDFDVHHGNGTEAIVRNLTPNVEKAAIRLPFAIGQMETPRYRPWLDETDINNVFFASTHGYGPRENRMDNIQPMQGGWFYPASGRTVTTNAILSPSSIENPSLNDFLLSQTWTRMGDESVLNCCKVINVGLSLPNANDIPGMQRIEVRDSYRKEILPHLMDFDPDIIFISAGFDAHKRDSMNFGYVGMVEDDYEWVTEQLVKVANACCNGRIISVLEGGYKIHGGIVSPFARSVASHVRALVDGGSSRELYDKQEGEWESRFERRMIEEKERKRQMKLDRARGNILPDRRRHFPPAIGEANNEVEGNAWNNDIETILKGPLSQGMSPFHNEIAGSSQTEQQPEDEEPSRKRRRQPVDYKVLYEQMKKENVGS